MALWLEPDAESIAPEAQADLDALSALRESAAIELKSNQLSLIRNYPPLSISSVAYTRKPHAGNHVGRHSGHMKEVDYQLRSTRISTPFRPEKGNEYVKMGKRNYKDAIDCYSRAIQQKSMDAVKTSILHANRAHVHLLLGNNRRALDDAQQAIELNKANVKAYFRGAKAALALESLTEAMQFCSLGLDQDSDNLELSKLRVVIENRLKEIAALEEQRALEVAKAEVLASIIADRRVSVGKPAYEEHTKGLKPWLDENKLLHWPVLFLYPESAASDFIEDFCEFDSFSSHLDVIFGPDTISPPWDSRHDYTREKVQLFYKANMGPRLSKMQFLCYLLEGRNIPDEIKKFEDVKADNNGTDIISHRWVRVSEKSSLHDVLARKDHVIPGTPVFYVLSKGSEFYEEFFTGRW